MREHREVRVEGSGAAEREQGRAISMSALTGLEL